MKYFEISLNLFPRLEPKPKANFFNFEFENEKFLTFRKFFEKKT